jgi:hypothetical protein
MVSFFLVPKDGFTDNIPGLEVGNADRLGMLWQRIKEEGEDRAG